jgi:hypothetical protein
MAMVDIRTIIMVFFLTANLVALWNIIDPFVHQALLAVNFKIAI